MKLTIGKKLILVGVLGSVIPLLGIGAVALWQGSKSRTTAEHECTKLACADLDHILEGVHGMLVCQKEVLEQKVTGDLNVASNELAIAGGMSLGTDTVRWESRNQLTESAQTVELPVMQLGEEPIEPNADPQKPSPLVDKVKSMVGGTCTVFQRMNDAGDMLRVSTNLLTTDGRRAINTFIPAVNPDGKRSPVVEAVLRGDRYVGRSFVVNNWYISAYEPIRAQNGSVIGMLFVGVPERSAKWLYEQIMDIAVGETGYVYVVDSKGNYVISQDGKRDGESIWDAKDSDGQLMIQSMIKKALTLKPQEIAEERYPWKNPEDPAPRTKVVRFAYFAPWDWIIGAGSYEDEFRGAELAIVHTNRQGNTIMAFMLGVCLIGLPLLWWLISRTIARPIRQTVAVLKDISEGEGDLTKRLTATSHDEIGDLARYFNEFVEKLQGIISLIAGNVQTVATSASGLTTTATQLASGAAQATTQSAQVAAAAEQTSASMTSMVAATEEMSTNVTTVSAAIEEFTTSVSEVAKSAERAASVAADASQLVDASNTQIHDLGNAADQIGKVIEVIQDIAEQTNLLALNATIEAARAGESGRGFAVVATEVKELAKQTANATEDIRQRIHAIQGSTNLAVKSMGGISDVIGQVNELSRIIATAVEEQSITTKEIAQNVAQSSSAAQTVAQGVAESASASQEIARIIVDVDRAAKQAAEGASLTEMSGRELSTVADQLHSLVGQFRV